MRKGNTILHFSYIIFPRQCITRNNCFCYLIPKFEPAVYLSNENDTKRSALLKISVKYVIDRSPCLCNNAQVSKFGNSISIMYVADH